TGADDSAYMPDLTSYDYDAPIKESGDVDNLKFTALRRVIKKYNSASLPSIPSNSEKRSYGRVEVQKIASLYEIVDSICDSMEVVEAK
ncbi:beta-galactosidase, partial [Staphylococcus aureus]|nr:beta-galactosidase [Staphylococcus aureus]